MKSPSQADANPAHLRTTLLNAGVSFNGINQFLAGQVVTNPTDRHALREMVQELLRVSLTFRNIDFTFQDGNKIFRDDWH
jgi:hypothetical protein